MELKKKASYTILKLDVAQGHKPCFEIIFSCSLDREILCLYPGRDFISFLRNLTHFIIGYIEYHVVKLIFGNSVSQLKVLAIK